MPNLSNIPLLQLQYRQYQYLQSVAIEKGLPTEGASFRAFCYILISYCNRYHQIQKKHSGWLPLSAKFLRQYFRGWDYRELEEKGLLLIDKFFSKQGKISRKYRPHPKILDGFLNAAVYELEEIRYVNSRDGKAWSEKAEERAYGGAEDNAQTELVQNAIQTFEISYFHHGRVLEHLGQLQHEANNASTKATREKAIRRLRNDQACYLSILKRLPSPPDENGICSFRPLYRELKSGRIGMAGGGFQSCTRAMKQAAFEALENMHNYDLSACQPRICLEEFRKWGLECEWLSDYLQHYEGRKKEYSSYIGISSNGWKDCLIPVLMGAALPTNTSGFWEGAILETLQEEIRDKEGQDKALKRLREVLKPLMGPLEEWHRLELEQAERRGYVINALGKKRALSDMNYPKSGVIAHLLQGAEALYIHHLTLLGAKHGFQPIQNEFDGLITLRAVPKIAIEEAKTITGMGYFELIEKPFC